MTELKRADLLGSTRRMCDALRTQKIAADVVNNDGYIEGSQSPAFIVHIYLPPTVSRSQRPPDTVLISDPWGWRIASGRGEGLHGTWTVEIVNRLPAASNAQAVGYTLADILLNVVAQP